MEIPAGIKSGSFLKYAGRGDDGAGDVPSGDLYVKILVQDSTKYARKTDDLYVKSLKRAIVIVNYSELIVILSQMVILNQNAEH